MANLYYTSQAGTIRLHSAEESGYQPVLNIAISDDKRKQEMECLTTYGTMSFVFNYDDYAKTPTCHAYTHPSRHMHHSDMSDVKYYNMCIALRSDKTVYIPLETVGFLMAYKISSKAYEEAVKFVKGLVVADYFGAWYDDLPASVDLEIRRIANHSDIQNKPITQCDIGVDQWFSKKTPEYTMEELTAKLGHEFKLKKGDKE